MPVVLRTFPKLIKLSRKHPGKPDSNFKVALGVRLETPELRRPKSASRLLKVCAHGLLWD